MKRLFSAVTRLSLRFRWVTLVIVVALLGLGVYAASKMNQELLPNIDFPQTFIFALQPGASSEDLRDLVTIPLENEIIKIKGVVPEGMQSTTTAPVSFVNVVNEYGVNSVELQKQIQAAIDKVVAEGVPKGLKTTADLTPDIMRSVLTKAPSMWKHFETQHLVAMSPDVLDAALSLNPDFAKNLDALTRDQIAAERVATAVSGTKADHAPVELPGAWVVTDDKVPKIRTFSLSSLPVITSSVFSADLKPEELRALVEKQIVAKLKSDVPGVADVSISGGQQVPKDVLDAAAAAVERANKAAASGASAQPTAAPAAPNTQAQPSAQATTPPAAPTQPAAPTTADGIPLVPASWRSFVTLPILNNLLHTPINNAVDLLNTKDGSGQKLTAAQALNLVADKNGNLLRDLPAAVITYLQGKENDLLKNLSPKALAALSADAYAAAVGEKPAPTLGSAWSTLAGQPGFKSAMLTTVRDLLYLNGGAAAGLNSIVAKTPTSLQNFAISVISSLSPDAIQYLNTHEKDFLTKLDPQVLRYLAPETLKALPDGFISGLKDDKLKADLQAIIADPSKAAATSLSSGAATIADDPNAPKLPESWTNQLKGFGINVVKADDLLRKPAGQPSAAAFINLLGARGGAAFMAPLSADVLIYLQAKDPTFYASLDPIVLGYLPKETLAKLPPEVAARAETGTAFTPTTTVTRTNGAESLTISVIKDSSANTVAVSDKVEEVFAQVMKDNPQIKITPAFEQASFIKESIGGVAREGGLGALMAVIVILIFLNFSFRSTLVTAVSIPTSVAIAFVAMYLLPATIHPLLVDLGTRGILPETLNTFLLRLFPASITLNIMTLSGLTVAIGRVVDDSIVVLENIYRQIQTGTKPLDAVLKGTRDVSLAIFAATVTTVVVFLPIGLTGGIIGEFFLPFGLAVTYSLIASFIVAITIVPLLAFWFIRQSQTQSEDHEGRLEHAYRGAILWSLDHRWIVLGVALVTLVIGLGLFGTRPTTFLPSFGEPQISVAVSLPNGVPLQQTDVRVRQLEDYLKTVKGIAKYQTVIGSGGGLASFVGGGGVTGNAAQITIAPDGLNSDQLTALTATIRTKAEEIFGSPKYVKVSKATLTDQGFGGFALVVSGPADKLQAVSAQITKTLSALPSFANVTSTLSQTEGAASTTYLRINRTPAIQFSAELETQNTLGATRDAIAAVKAIPNLPSDITVGEGFQSQQQTQGFSQTIGSLGLAIAIVYVVMVITFGSLVHPFTILFSLPLAVVGAALGLTITNRVLGISALIGLLMLVGIVVTNAIVFIDRVQQNRKERGMSAHDALVEAGRTRLRPILMTAIATMFALIPLAIGLSQGAIIASELGTVVIGGLFSSTILTLLVVPVVYSLLDAAQRAVLRRPEPEPAKAKIATGD